MSRGGGWGVSKRRPDIIKWSGAECRDCAAPVEVVKLTADPLKDPGTRIGIERAVINARPQPGMIAARVMVGEMIGYRITKLRPLLAGYCAFREHVTVCPEAPPPPFEQDSLFGDPTEGDTTP
jgi:hypothetical protein